MNCGSCRTSLMGKTYVEHDGLKYCEHCYKWNIADRCEECRNPIDVGQSNLNLKGKHYHKECLLCSKCHKTLDGQTFAVVDNKMVCNRCRGVPVATQCAKCKKDFALEEKKIGGGQDGKYFHEQCFRCSNCDRAIGTEKFVRLDDGNVKCLYCDRADADWKAEHEDGCDQQSCTKCRMKIDNKLVRFEGKPYHPECFICGQCREPLSGKDIYEHNKDYFDEACYLKYFGHRCAACYRAIKGTTKFTEYGGKHYHTECFACDKCRKPLVGVKFVTRDDKHICVNCR